MNDLSTLEPLDLTLEPRDAGPAVIEPNMEFEKGIFAEKSRTRCTGCGCWEGSLHQIETNSYAG